MWRANRETIKEREFLDTLFRFGSKGVEIAHGAPDSQSARRDWMVNDNGVLHGGFSIRYYRSTLAEDDRDEYDRSIGVVKYA